MLRKMKDGLLLSAMLMALTLVVSIFSAPGILCAGWLDSAKELLGTVQEVQGEKGAITSTEAAGGLKEALRIGSEAVVGRLGKNDGFNSDPAVHIPLPDSLKTVQNVLGKFGMSGLLDDLELRLNRAAEAATPKAKELFMNAISDMSFDDSMNILKGPEDSATRYFESKMSTPLADEMRPIVESSLAEAGAVQVFDNAMGEYKKLPFVPDVKADLTGHVLDRGLAGIFHYLAEEEKSIRGNPARWSSDLLKKVFQNQ